MTRLPRDMVRKIKAMNSAAWEEVIGMRLIDADALIGQLHFIAFEDGDDRSLVYAVIQEQKTVEPQRMRGKGRWNAYYHGEENGKSIFSYSCNQCGYGAPYNFIGGVCEQKKWNFCPNCGADMRGGQDVNH